MTEVRRVAVFLAVVVVALALLVGSASPSASPPARRSGAVLDASSSPRRGGTVYWALPPATTPDWIFPFASLQFFSVTNFAQFQYLMYRPLYWFGPPTSTSPNVDFALSLADQPVWSNGNRTVTITMKGWKFRDGQRVDAQSLVFWLNMMKAESSNWAGSVPGPSQFPANVRSYAAPGGPTGDKVVLNLNHRYGTKWFLYNELSQLQPMPEAWDVTSLKAAPGSGRCGAVAPGAMTGAATKAACAAVWRFDTDNNDTAKQPHMAGNLATYATNKHWSEGVDGPWRLSAFNAASGEATFVPNAKYSGPQKPTISQFVEVPYASGGAEFNALLAGAKTAPQVGYLPLADTPPKPAGQAMTVAGRNAPGLARAYKLVEFESWQISYTSENYRATVGAHGYAGSVFRQLYFRQVLQELVNQPGIISTYFKGYGVPTYGPVPVYPANSFLSTVERERGGPYPFNPPKAIATLRAHGWNVVTNGVSTCVRPGTAAGDCGAGIARGTPLTFKEVYTSNDKSLAQAVDYEVSEWATAGIQVSVSAEPIDQILNQVVPCYPSVTAACHAWDLANWGGGWVYSPDYMPTGEETFATGAGSNEGGYSNLLNDRLTVETNEHSSLGVFYEWENFLSTQLPVIWQPVLAGEAEVSKQLGGVLPINALGDLMPEYWYFKS